MSHILGVLNCKWRLESNRVPTFNFFARSAKVPLRLCQCERASIRFAAAETEGLARSILDRTSVLTALAGLPAREDVRIAGHTTAPTEPRLAVAWGNGLRGLGADEHREPDREEWY